MGIFGDILGGVGGFVGGLVGNGEASGDQEASRKALLDALAAYNGVSVPQLGELLSQSQAGDSAAASIDPAARDAQLHALYDLQKVADSGGMTMADRVAQEQANQRAANYERGQRGAIDQDLAARGQAGGPAGLAAKLAALQGGANEAYAAGTGAAANASQRALEAMAQSGNAAGAVRSGDLNQAQLSDVMSRFNAAQRSGAYQSNFNDQMAKAGGVAGADTNLGQYYSGNAQRIRNQYTGMGQGLGTALGGAGDAIAGASGAPTSGSSTPYYLADPNKQASAANWWEG